MVGGEGSRLGFRIGSGLGFNIGVNVKFHN